MPFIDAMEGSRAIAAFEETWGHLRPAEGDYAGYIEVTVSAFGDSTVHNISFEGVDSNPFTFDTACAFAIEGCPDGEHGVYRWTGTYRLEKLPEDPDRTITEGEYRHLFVDGQWEKVY